MVRLYLCWYKGGGRGGRGGRTKVLGYFDEDGVVFEHNKVEPGVNFDVCRGDVLSLLSMSRA